MNPDAATALLAAILTGIPSLPEAACRRRAPLFDDQHPGETTEQQQQRLNTARTVCQDCPAQAGCRAALHEQPPRWGGIGVQTAQILVALARRRAASSAGRI
ncbi:MAG: hypothetical protein ACRDTG_10870 [Pseudonocardiaceae bacterium]